MGSVTVRVQSVAGTAAIAHALAAAIGAATPAPTMAAVNTNIAREQHQAVGSRSAGVEKLRADHGTATSGTALDDVDNAIVDDGSPRPTTEAERVIGEIRDYTLLSENWDGEGAAAPVRASLADAAVFVQMLGAEVTVPEPMLFASGRAGLFWDDEGLYADLEFTGEGTVTYYVERDGGKHKGVAPFAGEAVPEVLRLLLRARA